MRYSDFALITDDVPKMKAFYETVFGHAAEGDHIHAQLEVRGTGISIYSRKAAEDDMGFDFSRHNGTGRTTFGFIVQDVDAEYERLRALGTVEFVLMPKTYPWGARSIHFRDPDGNILCFSCFPNLEP